MQYSIFVKSEASEKINAKKQRWETQIKQPCDTYVKWSESPVREVGRYDYKLDGWNL